MDECENTLLAVVTLRRVPKLGPCRDKRELHSSDLVRRFKRRMMPSWQYWYLLIWGSLSGDRVGAAGHVEGGEPERGESGSRDEGGGRADLLPQEAGDQARQ